jgi:ubiquitin-conjugating enzyme E2 G1
MAVSEGNRSKAFLLKEYRRLQENPSEHYSIGLIDENVYVWEVLILGPRRTPYENGIFQAKMIFPLNYPEAPPTFRFISEMWHPNIDKDGNVCISILHKPGEDEYGYESADERWLPVRHPESVILSIISLLSSPNCESPANIDAAQQHRDDEEGYNRKIVRLTAKTIEFQEK